MSFWSDFAEGLKDVGTSATRIVTDTAIDIGDVATGFQFSDEMQAAKQKMSDAGVLSAADAIEKNHYPFLEKMEKDAEKKLVQVQSLFNKGQAAESRGKELIETLSDMCADVSLLSQESLEAEALLAEARKIPHWEKWLIILEIPPSSLSEIDQISVATQRWQAVGKSIATAGLVVGATDGAAALVALATLSKGRKLTKLAKAGRAGGSSALKASAKASKIMSKASKFMKIGKTAGRASGVLAVVTVGLDVGLSVAELEIKKSELEDTLAILNREIAAGKQALAAVQRENASIQSNINALLNSVQPPQTLGSWLAWVEDTRRDLRAVIERLITASGAIRRAEDKAVQTRGKPMTERIRRVAAVDPDISEAEARQIIDRLDSAAGIAEPLTDEQLSQTEVSALSWKVDGLLEARAEKMAGLDGISLTYTASETDSATWTYYATAPWTRSLPIEWRYGATHASPASIGKVVVFSDGPSGRHFTTLHAAIPKPISQPDKGTGAIQVYKGQAFGVMVTVQANDTSGLQEVCGTYKRHPVENNWHVGTIDVQDELGVALQWTNHAGVSWDLLPHLKADLLLKTPGSPYQDAYEGSNEFAIVRENGKVTGFDFIKEFYALDAPAVAPPAKSSGITLGLVSLEFLD